MRKNTTTPKGHHMDRTSTDLYPVKVLSRKTTATMRKAFQHHDTFTTLKQLSRTK
jgi:hypothetical protein